MHKDIPILLIDDSPDFLRIFSYGLEKIIPTATIIRASSEKEVSDYLTDVERGIRFPARLTLLDLYMPRKEDGLRILEQINAQVALTNTVPAPIIIFSASGERIDISDCYRQGASAYVIKPVLTRELTAVFRHIRDYWLDTVTLPDLNRI